MKPLLTMAFIGAGVALALQTAAAQSTKPALYTQEQATAGAGIYAASCGTCHGNQLEGVAAPALKGDIFGQMATAQNLTVSTLMDVVFSTMPQSDPGSLKPDEYDAVVAYILQQNGYPAGSTPLAKDQPQLKDVKITP
jgi:mono/diheme cytochrome c family protein